ncbi:hypothetical protein IFM89_013078 [Coptis chinensis]|uniref:Methyltransferase n=1 Tax=Coptis chinensis TaxID=261450 RepID=A0A835HMN6_9MAGN|nr:hypothetical protein IFM89_013078 [Coptis chinensis]
MKTDCVGCFDLVNGTEEYRFVQAKSKNDFLVHDVMDLGSGEIRIGLDNGGGSGTFAAMMHGREKCEGGHQEKIEFLMFDIDRVLRAGGLFWLDNFHCVDEEKKMTLTRVIERFGYKKLKLVVGEKIVYFGKSQTYLSAVLQKPLKVRRMIQVMHTLLRALRKRKLHNGKFHDRPMGVGVNTNYMAECLAIVESVEIAVQRIILSSGDLNYSQWHYRRGCRRLV